MAWIAHKIGMGFNYGEFEQGDLSDDEFYEINVEITQTNYFYVGSELMEVALVSVVLDINYLQMGVLFVLYGLF